MQVAWREAATPAIAQEMDAAVKGKEVGIYDTEAAQETSACPRWSAPR
jgi:hypothetical protein